MRRGPLGNLDGGGGGVQAVIACCGSARKHHRVAKAEWLHNAISDLAAFAIEECDEYPRLYLAWRIMAAKSISTFATVTVPSSKSTATVGGRQRTRPSDSTATTKCSRCQYPKKGGTLDALKQFVNIHPNDWPLFIGALLGCLLPEGTYPILSLIGGDGRCKTCLLIVILSIDRPEPRSRATAHPIRMKT